LTVTGDATISGNLTVSGTTTYINTTTLNVGDNIITLNADIGAATAPTENAGIEVKRGNAATKQFIWNESTDRWSFDDTINVAGNVVLSGTIDTGQGATEVHLMNQNVRTTDAVTFATVNTGQGANELYAMDQNVRTTDSPTFDGLTIGDSGNTGTTLNIIATNTAGAPAATAVINMAGYEGRAIGTFYTDVSYSGQEWFSGLRYNGSFANYQIGYDVSTGQSEYSAQSLLTIDTLGEATFKSVVNTTELNTGQGDNEMYAIDHNV
jgi:hypothetical protein